MVFSQNHGRNGIHECTPYGETPSGTDCASHWALGKPTAKTTAHEIAAIARIRFLLLCWKVSTFFLVGQHTSEALYPIVGTAFGRFGVLGARRCPFPDTKHTSIRP